MNMKKSGILLPDRREALRLGAKSMLALAGMGLMETGRTSSGIALAQTTIYTATPSETEGPYWVDEKLNRSDVRVDPSDGTTQAGFPLRLNVSVSRLTSGVITPLTGAYVDIWHCNATGLYSDIQAEGTKNKKYLRGYQVTDAHGQARFLTVYPGWYRGRTVHIHARIRLYTGTTTSLNFATQFFFNDAVSTQVFALAPYNTRGQRDTLNTNDMVYTGASGTIASNSGAYLLLRMAKDGTHAIGSFNIALSI